MKNLFILLAIILFSCSKQEIELEKEHQKTIPIAFDVHINNNIIQFKDLKDFQSALLFFSDREKLNFSEEQYKEWAKRNQFSSLRLSKFLIDIDFELIQSKEDITNFESKYGNVISEDGQLIHQMNNKSLSSILNSDGLVSIGGAMHLFHNNKQYISLENDIELLANIKKGQEVTQNDKLIINDYISDLHLRDCATVLECEKTVNNKKVKGLWEVNTILTPIWNNTCLCYTHWEFGISHHFVVNSYKKNWLGIFVKNHDDDIQFHSDYDISSTWFGNFSGWTGWTHNGWEVDFNIPLANDTWPFNQQLPEYSGRFIPNTNNNVNNITVTSLDCGTSCQ